MGYYWGCATRRKASFHGAQRTVQMNYYRKPSLTLTRRHSFWSSQVEMRLKWQAHSLLARKVPTPTVRWSQSVGRVLSWMCAHRFVASHTCSLDVTVHLRSRLHQSVAVLSGVAHLVVMSSRAGQCRSDVKNCGKTIHNNGVEWTHCARSVVVILLHKNGLNVDVVCHRSRLNGLSVLLWRAECFRWARAGEREARDTSACL
jgi:hypothetical protein